jgi:predicted transcriptional regulator
MKHGEGRDVARQLYVEQQMTFDEIARHIGRSDKTVREWADAEGWKKEREEFLAQRIRTHEKLHSLIGKLTDRMINDCTGENEISPQSLLALNKLVTTVKNLYQYESTMKQTADADHPKDQDGLSEETMQKIESQMKLL